MALLSDSREILPIHRKILAFTFIGWIFDFYDLLLLPSWSRRRRWFVISGCRAARPACCSGRRSRSRPSAG
jgi:hypothetical protein